MNLDFHSIKENNIAMENSLIFCGGNTYHPKWSWIPSMVILRSRGVYGGLMDFTQFERKVIPSCFGKLPMITPTYKPWKCHLEVVPQPYLGDLRSPWLLTTYKSLGWFLKWHVISLKWSKRCLGISLIPIKLGWSLVSYHHRSGCDSYFSSPNN